MLKHFRILKKVYIFVHKPLKFLIMRRFRRIKRRRRTNTVSIPRGGVRF